VQQGIIEPVDVLKVINGTALGVFLVNAHVVVQQAVHTDIVEPD